MALIAIFWLEFWRVLFLSPPALHGPGDDRPTAQIIDLAQWRGDHPKPESPNGRAA
jgi:hypothetical protein